MAFAKTLFCGLVSAYGFIKDRNKVLLYLPRLLIPEGVAFCL